MAKQRGALTIEGSIGDITFYKSKHGFLVKEKSVVSRERRALDPAYQRTRENNEEFGTASKASKLFRAACHGLSVSMGDDLLRSRLMKVMVRLLQKDTINRRGKRQVLDEHTVLLEGFDFNTSAVIRTVLQAPFGVEADRATGAVWIGVPSFNPQWMLAKPEGATHFKLVMGAAVVDFAGGHYQAGQASSGYLPYGGETVIQLLEVGLPEDRIEPIFVVFGVAFYQEVNGHYYLLKDCEYNALSVVKVLIG